MKGGVFVKKEDLIRKLGSRKFWACVSAVVIALVAFINADPETTERIVALVSAVGGLCIYMLSEGIADSKSEDVTNYIETKDYMGK
ncbi:hypothetical protein [Peptoniphilus rhinitidis]|uniref:hypothetical protein n=1 Tax=Peptoniphilus rhinitidis TaxID=1175452 RepID=UPI001F2696F6|nr:hypothetical protein [Peptoniphilus rhinitidis]